MLNNPDPFTQFIFATGKKLIRLNGHWFEADAHDLSAQLPTWSALIMSDISEPLRDLE